VVVAAPVKFFLGTHEVRWLARLDVPLFVSHRRLAPRRTLPRALTGWALDSGGFTELSMHGRWTTSPQTYVTAVRRYSDEIGQLEWAAPQDWMCEPFMVAKTGLTVAEHQRRTVDSVLELRALAPDLPFVPVLQGWELDDYLACIDLYTAAGIDLTAEPTVGLGSVCRRQAESEIADVCSALNNRGIQLHGFGVKTSGLRYYGRHLHSADSMAWSYNARKHPALPGHPHRTCANCPDWAMRWRQRVLRGLDTQQLTLWEAS
jgi:hypothetical protein